MHFQDALARIATKRVVYGTSSDIFCDSSVVLVANINLMIYVGGDGKDVTLLTALPGNFDLDNDVDGNNFLFWQRGGSPSRFSASDLADWKADYGMVALLSAAMSESAKGVTVLLTMMALLLRRDLVDVAMAEEVAGVSGKREFMIHSPPLEFFSAWPIGRTES